MRRSPRPRRIDKLALVRIGATPPPHARADRIECGIGFCIATVTLLGKPEPTLLGTGGDLPSSSYGPSNTRRPLSPARCESSGNSPCEDSTGHRRFPIY